MQRTEIPGFITNLTEKEQRLFLPMVPEVMPVPGGNRFPILQTAIRLLRLTTEVLAERFVPRMNWKGGILSMIS